MTLDEVFKIIDQLTPHEKHQVKQYIEQQQDVLRREIDDILATAEPVELKAGTMNIDSLLNAVQGMWEGLDENAINEIVQAMNEEYIEPDRMLDE